MNQLSLVLSLSLCFVACATEAPLAAPPAAEAPATKPPTPAAPPIVAEPAPKIEAVTATVTPEPVSEPKPLQARRPSAERTASALHLVAVRRECTKIGCPESKPCCNTCQISWRSSDSADPSALKLSGVPVPDPVQKECGVAFSLDLKGHYEGDTFVVASFEKVPPRKSKEPIREHSLVSQTLHAVAAPPACTEKKCPESDPCCNRCEYGSWQKKGAARGEYLKLRGSKVPAPEQKGCGVAFDLELTGRSDGKYFYVSSFQKLPPSTR